MKNTNRKFLGSFILLYILLYYVVIFLGDPSVRITVFIRNLISTTGPFIASVWLFVRFLKGEKKKDYFWLFLSLGAFNYFLAEILWMYYESYLYVDVPYPGSPDVFYMLQIIFYLLALGYYFYQVNTVHRLMRWIFEVLIIMVSATTLSYHYLMKSVIATSEVTGAYLFVSLGYPVGDLILFISAVILYFDSFDFGKRKALFFIVVGLMFQVFADSGYVYLTLREKYETGTLLDPLFTLALLLVGYSSFYSISMKKTGDEPVCSENSPTKVGLWKMVILYTSLMAVLLMFYKVEGIEFSLLSVGISLIIFLIILRLISMLVENNRLALKYDEKNKDLSISNQRYLSLYKFHPDAVFSLDMDGVFQSANDACKNMIGVDRSELLGRSLYEFIDLKEYERVNDHLSKTNKEPQFFEINIINHSGKIYSTIMTLVPIVINDKVEGIFGIGKDITELKENINRINYLAYHDMLTGLLNRASFENRLNAEIERALAKNTRLAVMYIDLDRFKNINDTLGHDAGDELLVDMSKRLTQCVGKQAVIARQGGDEFTLLFHTICHRKEIIKLAELVRHALSQPYIIRNYEFLATPSIGISILNPGEAETAISLMKKADLAMYKAKSNGKNQFRIFEESMEQDSKTTFVLGSDLSKAIQKDELVLHYQPQYDTKSNRMYGAEALLRWRHPELGLLYPSDFISIAEDSDLIISIGEWVLREACRQGKLWGEKLGISVNISPKQFQSAYLVDTIKNILAETNLTPKLLTIEITEAIAMSNMNETLKKLEAIRMLGVKISIDDFGTGYSSLAYLPKLPITQLKIPREFLMETEQQVEYKAVLQTIITLGKRLNIDVIAEGVETKEHKEILEEMECHFMQGYYFSKPVSVEEVEDLLTKVKAML